MNSRKGSSKMGVEGSPPFFFFRLHHHIEVPTHKPRIRNTLAQQSKLFLKLMPAVLVRMPVGESTTPLVARGKVHNIGLNIPIIRGEDIDMQ